MGYWHIGPFSRMLRPIAWEEQEEALSAATFGAGRIVTIALRLSIVAAVVAGALATWDKAAENSRLNSLGEEIWSALQCAARIDDAKFPEVGSDSVSIDISRYGCGNKSPFWANRREINLARAGDKASLLTPLPTFNIMWFGAAALTWFLGINLLVECTPSDRTGGGLI